MNDLRNLVVLCRKCHDDYHAGTVEVLEVEQTSEGPMRKMKELASFAYKDMTEDQETAIKNDLRGYKPMSPEMLLVRIKKDHGVTLTKQRLKTLRASL
jgi:hypothetical protein